jgi:flagellar motility protein MotE (MotC chaperone)
MLKSPWFIVILGVLLGVGTSAFLVMKSLSTVVAAAAPKTPKATEQYVQFAPRDWTMRSNDFEKLAKDLAEQKTALEARKKDLDDYSDRLANERKEIEKVRVQVDEMRKLVTDNLPKLDASEKVNIKSLAKTYSTMAPIDAVAVLREMDDSTIVKILSVMKADVVGAIFQEMARTKDGDATLATRAAHISDQLRLLQTPPTTSATTP